MTRALCRTSYVGGGLPAEGYSARVKRARTKIVGTLCISQNDRPTGRHAAVRIEHYSVAPEGYGIAGGEQRSLTEVQSF